MNATRAIPGRAKGKSPVVSPLQAGALVAGRFRLERLLGEGGMAAVWAAQHEVTKRHVAIKVLKGPAHPELIQRFIREARAANAVQHPNVVQVHDVFELEHGLAAMVMDRFEGESLGSLLERRGALSLAEVVRLSLPVVSALEAIHAAGIVHRDLKPHNVFLAKLPGGETRPIILDFGICKLDEALDSLAQSDVCTTAGRMMGTPCYMAPEQVRGAVDIDARVDVWALGVMLYECVSGKLPWPTDSMARIVAGITSGPVLRVERAAPQLPAALVTVVNRMLLRDAAQRLSNLREVLAVLEGVASSSVPQRKLLSEGVGPVSAPSPSQQMATLIRPRPEPGPHGELKRRRRSRYVALGAGALLLSCSLVTALMLARPGTERSTAETRPSKLAQAGVAPRADPPAAARDALLLPEEPAGESPLTPRAIASAKPRSVPPKASTPRKPAWRDYGGRR
jgi:serine/threonine-protein kinase